MLDLAAGARPGGDHARGPGLAYSLTSVGLDGLGGRKPGWLAFRHDKDEYGINSAGAEEPRVPGDAPTLEGIPALTSPLGCRAGGLEGRRAMEERDFFNERTEQRTHTLTCPKCGQAGEYKVTWVMRRKRAQLPRNADERDRARFAKAQSYMVRLDDKLACANIRCRKPFEITQLQTLAFLSE